MPPPPPQMAALRRRRRGGLRTGGPRMRRRISSMLPPRTSAPSTLSRVSPGCSALLTAAGPPSISRRRTAAPAALPGSLPNTTPTPTAAAAAAAGGGGGAAGSAAAAAAPAHEPKFRRAAGMPSGPTSHTSPPLPPPHTPLPLPPSFSHPAHPARVHASALAHARLLPALQQAGGGGGAGQGAARATAGLRAAGCGLSQRHSLRVPTSGPKGCAGQGAGPVWGSGAPLRRVCPARGGSEPARRMGADRGPFDQ